MNKILFLWDKLVWLLNQVNKEVENTVVQVIVDYWIVFIIVGVTVYMFRLGIYMLYKLINYIYCKYARSNRSIVRIRWEVELKVFFERIYYGFGIYKVNTNESDKNKFRKSRKYAPSGIFQLLIVIIKLIMPIHIYNVLLWGIVIVYKAPVFVDIVYQNINIGTLENTVTYIKSIGLNNFTEVLKNISFIIMACLVITGCWSYLSTYRKVSNQKLEKVLANQDRLINIIGKILYKLEENIDIFFSMKNNLPLFLSDYITCADAYNFENGKLVIFNKYKINYEYGEKEYIEQKLYEFKSYKEEIENLNDMIKDVEKDYLWATIGKFYKSMWYEEVKMHLISKEPLKFREGDLLDRERLIEWMSNSSDKYLKKRFEKIGKVKSGLITQEAYEAVDGLNIKISFEYDQKSSERELEEKLIKFSMQCDKKIREAIEAYLILEKYLYKLEKLSWRLGFFSKTK